MAVVASSLSVVCKGLMEFLRDELNRGEMKVTVSLGTPADAAPGEQEANHRLNLFFFRFEGSGFQPDNLPGETWLLRAYCMITPFALLEDAISAGENDLRLLGEVLRILHEHPVFRLEVNGEAFHIQAVFQNLGLEQINQLWSTQGDTVYRPSLLYEFSLTPVVPQTPAVPPKRVAETRSAVVLAGDTAGEHLGYMPGDRRIAPDTQSEDWQPAICFVQDGRCLESLRFEAGGTVPTPAVWLAGEPGSAVRLQWESWSETGWATAGDPVDTVVTDTAIDPERIGSAATVAMVLPATDAPGQYLLYAARTYTRAADGSERTVRSNPLLVTLTEPSL